jgi:uncharacterized protein YihD (DUF1040 family)
MVLDGVLNMRDPDRIPRILKKLEQAWTAHPDLRLGQLLVNLVGHPLFFHTDDAIAESRLDAHIAAACSWEQT